MASQQIISYGAKVERSENGTSGWDKIPECKGIAVPQLAQEYPEVTNFDSPGGFREFIKGLKDLGEITVPCGYTSEGFAQQIADRDRPSPLFYRVTLAPAADQTTGDVFEFEGFPNPAPVDNGIGEPISMDITIRATGDLDWTAGS